MTQKTYIARNACDLSFGDLLWPNLHLAFFKSDVDTHGICQPFLTYASTLGESELLAVRVADKRAQDVKTLHFDV